MTNQEGKNRCFDTLITDFSDELFQEAFKQCFDELEIKVADWDGLFREMNGEGDNAAFLRMTADGKVIGFIQFKPEKFASWFFEETYGFVREIWVSKDFRDSGHGSELISLTERYFMERGIFTSILTTDTAGRFYEKRGYRKAPGCKAKNKDDVFIKRLK